ncbi:MAG: penicillin-binding protein 1C [Pseudomonadota bacterium]
MKRKIAILLSVVLVAAVVLVRLIPAPPISSRFSSSQAFYDERGELLRLILSTDDKYRLWLPLDAFPPHLVRATLDREDRHFYHHFGVNPVSLLRGAWSTYVTRNRRVGGSTVTMQAARMIYNLRSRTIATKLEQITLALGLELRHSKREILEAYLNLASYGGNIEGVGAASLAYFGKLPKETTPEETAALAAIPPNPSKRSKRFRVPPSLPFEAPHFVQSLIRAETTGSIVRTTLDRRLQRLLERQIGSYLTQVRSIGMRNAAALLVDFRSMEIKAAIGSAGFWEEEIDGQVDGTRAKRSPGSTLKPFIYALGLDQGVISSETMLKDAPMRFGPYNPENFDGQFVGPVSAHEALVRSRNVPAVFIASQLSRPSFYTFLKNVGISGLKPEEHYGLSLVLGGAELTMWEIAGLYAALANRGELRPLRTRLDDPLPKEGIPVLSAEATFIVNEMLQSAPPPEVNLRSEWLKNPLPVAWKTGTSFGFRDAWTAGIFGPYVLVVWLGNFRGEGNPALIGIRAAAPLFFRIVDAVRAERPEISDRLPGQPPKGVSLVSVCAISGKIPGPNCPHKRPGWFIPGKSPIDICDIHREVRLSDRSGLRVCPGFTGPVQTAVSEFWPSDLQRLFATAGLPRRTPPPFDPSCDTANRQSSGTAPKISSPSRGVVYEVRVVGREEERLSLDATADADVRDLYWFIDTAYIGRSQPKHPLLWAPKEGAFVVRVIDDQGRADSRSIRISVAP